jgi:oligosaccharyltransferase complex subunit alpha (ribophorin I)
MRDCGFWVLTNVTYSNVEFASPFPALSSSMSTHISYLDTTGRPAVTFTYKDLIYKHTGVIYVSAYLVCWV